MNWLLFFLLAALHPVAFVLIGLKSKTWRQRLLLWALLPLPAIWYCWDYFVIVNEHEQMCAAEAGLKVLIQPEKVDRIRFVGVHFRDTGAAVSSLKQYYPRLRSVEALRGQFDGTDGASEPYVAYSVEPILEPGWHLIDSLGKSRHSSIQTLSLQRPIAPCMNLWRAAYQSLTEVLW